ncbi:hypothetical protein [Paenibacillus terrigena]|uniref:hypothetical protein n=1 Tax=Paenibacillus terrigena TaxID=369333 RepID=UPI0028D2810D|nr:hypothetical protein [Paenibacillus terrigena]
MKKILIIGCMFFGLMITFALLFVGIAPGIKDRTVIAEVNGQTTSYDPIVHMDVTLTGSQTEVMESGDFRLSIDIANETKSDLPQTKADIDFYDKHGFAIGRMTFSSDEGTKSGQAHQLSLIMPQQWMNSTVTSYRIVMVYSPFEDEADLRNHYLRNIAKDI